MLENDGLKKYLYQIQRVKKNLEKIKYFSTIIFILKNYTADLRHVYLHAY